MSIARNRPSRSTSICSVRSMRSRSSTRIRSSTPLMSTPSSRITTSPGNRPACAAGPSCSMFIKMGALLMNIEQDGPAAQAGLLPGDVVIRLDGVDINGVDDLIRVLDRDRIDRTLQMDVLRLGRLRAIDIHPVERKKVKAA